MRRIDNLAGMSAAELTELLAGEPTGVPAGGGTLRLAAPGEASPEHVCVAFDADALREATLRKAGLVVAPESLRSEGAIAGTAALLVRDARLALAVMTEAYMSLRPLPGVPGEGGVSATARIDESARLSAGVSVGEHAVIGRDAVLEPGVTVGAYTEVGAGCHLHAGAHVYDHVVLGERVILHSGAVIGADGFGFVPSEAGPVKLHHLGTVELADDVEVGANSAVDRGLLGATSVGRRTKIDNHVQVGHNVTIGEECLIAGHAAIGGSSTIGHRVTIAGKSSVTDHVRVGDGATLAGMSGLSRDLPAGEVWLGIPAMPIRRFSRRQYLLSRLEEIWRFVRDRRSR